ncbi:MAG: hypothetical protein H0U00_12975 [Actinobacteria bacterium]|nr:hypothetical protein [Actinomycetota bacterium]
MSSPSPSERQGRRKTNLLGALVVAVALGLVAAAAFVLGDDGPTGGDTASERAWTSAPAMLHRRSYSASAEVGGDIYVAAGMVGNTGRPLDLFERFDVSRNEWTSLPGVPKAFSAGAAAALDGLMYVVGGNSDEADGRQVLVYDIEKERWSERAPLPAPRTNLAVVAHEQKIYALGGLDPVDAINTVFVYDPMRDRWSQAAPLPEALHALAAVSFRGEIWAIGGRVKPGVGEVSRRIWIYNASRDRWRAGPSMPEPVETHGAAVVDDRIHVVLESLYLIYDAREGRWTRGPSQRVPRHALVLFNAGGRLYAIGGCTVPQLEDSTVVESIASGS